MKRTHTAVITALPAALFGCASLLPRSAMAQFTPATPQQVRRMGQNGFGGQPARRGSLGDLVDKLDWDPASRGPLLIVSPEETTYVFQRSQPGEDGQFVPPASPPTPGANGAYRVTDVTDYFDRRLVPLSTITVLAPKTMAVLNYAHLPKPDAYAGMSSSDKAQLLESTFTPDQWRRIASPGGIGVGDLKGEQRDIYLSLLPDPFVVVPPMPAAAAATGAAGDVPMPRPRPVTLTPEQREGVRVSLRRKLSWMFKVGDNGMMGIGVRIDPSQPRLQNARFGFGPHSDAFGVSLKEDVPNHSKPSQLPYDWHALDVRTALDKATTVGDLVRQIARQTGAELFCDPRYDGRKLYTRGTFAQAGDVLHALAWAVTGTWRRVGTEAYVLTDDIVGLGVRHAMIDVWVRQNSLLAEERVKKVDAALKDSHFADYIQWSDSDPMRPSEGLIAKLEANTTSSLFVPAGELPAAAQDVVKQQLDQIGQMGQLQNTFPDGRVDRPSPRTDGVMVTEGLDAAYIVPDVGNIDADDLNRFGMNRDLRGRPQAMFSRGTQPTPRVYTPPPLAFPVTLSARALLISSREGLDVAKIAEAAHRAGFTQLWVATPRGETESVSTAVRAGAANGLAVRAVIPLLQAKATDKPDLRDRDILGDTLTQYVTQWRGYIKQMGIVDDDATAVVKRINQGGGGAVVDAWKDDAKTERMLRHGDYLRCDEPDVVSDVSAAVLKTAGIAGLAGVVFADTAAPGYDTPMLPGRNISFGGADPAADPLLQMGYNEPMRLACLRKNGFDPIDLSPLANGARINLPFGISQIGPQPDIDLPFFADYGSSGGAGAIINGERVSSLGAKDAWDRWHKFREDLDAQFLQSVVAAVRAQSPTVSMMLRRSATPMGDELASFGSVDAANQAAAAPPPPAAPQPAATDPRRPRAGSSNDSFAAAMRGTSKVAYYSVKYDPTRDTTGAPDSFVRTLPSMLQRSGSWDGAVVDLSEASPERTTEILDLFPVAAAPSAPITAGK